MRKKLRLTHRLPATLVTEELYKKVEEYAETHGSNSGATVRQALELFFTTNDSQTIKIEIADDMRWIESVIQDDDSVLMTIHHAGQAILNLDDQVNVKFKPKTAEQPTNADNDAEYAGRLSAATKAYHRWINSTQAEGVDDATQALEYLDYIRALEALHFYLMQCEQRPTRPTDRDRDNIPF